MPMKPLKPCKQAGCPELTDKSYCYKHSSLVTENRANPSKRGYDIRWRKARIRFLKDNPLCVYCLKENRVVEATVVDHIVPHRGDNVLFWDKSNWQPLCKRCHDKKTGREEKYPEYKF